MSRDRSAKTQRLEDGKLKLRFVMPAVMAGVFRATVNERQRGRFVAEAIIEHQAREQAEGCDVAIAAMRQYDEWMAEPGRVLKGARMRWVWSDLTIDVEHAEAVERFCGYWPAPLAVAWVLIGKIVGVKAGGTGMEPADTMHDAAMALAVSATRRLEMVNPDFINDLANRLNPFERMARRPTSPDVLPRNPSPQLARIVQAFERCDDISLARHATRMDNRFHQIMAG